MEKKRILIRKKSFKNLWINKKPYPNFPIKTPVLILTLQRYGFLFNPQIFEAFFSNQDSFFLHLPSFPAFLILLDRVSSF
jgi:hypothetical protein